MSDICRPPGLHYWRPGELAWVELVDETHQTLFNPTLDEIEYALRDHGLDPTPLMESIRDRDPSTRGILFDIPAARKHQANG